MRICYLRRSLSINGVSSLTGRDVLAAFRAEPNADIDVKHAVVAGDAVSHPEVVSAREWLASSYDAVLVEAGLVQGLNEPRVPLAALEEYVRTGGVLVVMDADVNEVETARCFYESARKLFGATPAFCDTGPHSAIYGADEACAVSGDKTFLIAIDSMAIGSRLRGAHEGIDQVLASWPVMLYVGTAEILASVNTTTSSVCSDVIVDQGYPFPWATANHFGEGYALLLAGGMSHHEWTRINPDNAKWVVGLCRYFVDEVARERFLLGTDSRSQNVRKYDPLRDYLSEKVGDEVGMTFADVESLVGPLPDSARNHPEWWANDSKVQAQAWRAAGWHVKSVNQTTGEVVFARRAVGQAGSTSQTEPGERAPYIDTRLIESISARTEWSEFDFTKLLRLVRELHDSYARNDAYASHALLRAILDHIPPMLGCSDFTAVANNYPWGRTDKRYMSRLLDFRLQADDALHRQISDRPDLLGMDDLPPRAWVNRLLQECMRQR